MTDEEGPDELTADAKALRDIFHRKDTARARAMLEREDLEGLEAAMIVLASCCRDLIVRRPLGGADLGAILIGHQFKNALQKHGLAIVPEIPTGPMRAAWKKVWFRAFHDRYSAALRAAWD
jgi:hypothetical protein